MRKFIRQARIIYRLYGSGDQGWYCPHDSLTISHDHTNIYQVNVTEISSPFHQTKDQIYWLAIQADMGTSKAEVGWKTSTSSYFGKAVYQTMTGGWAPIGTKDDNLAFVITGSQLIEVDQIPMSEPETEIITPLGKEKLTVSGPLTQHVFFEGINEGAASDDNGDGLDDVELEIVDLDWTGNGPLLGPVRLRVHPDIPSVGLIEEMANNTPGILDVPPFTAAGLADMTLDFYFEIEFGGQVLYTDQPSRLEAIINHKPPGPLNWFSVNEYIPLLNADGSISRCYFGLGSDWVRPFWEVDPFDFSRVRLEITKPGGSTEFVDLSGFSSMYTVFSFVHEGDASDGDSDGRDEVDTEMAALDLSGTGPTFGPVNMRLRPGIRSLGEIEELTNNNPGKLDIPPFTPTGSADSFFDVFCEIEIGGQVYHNAQPLRWYDVINHKPPKDASYEDEWQSVTLYDDNGNPTGLNIVHSFYWPGNCGDNEHPIPIGDFNMDCIVNFLDFAVFADHWLECTRPICP